MKKSLLSLIITCSVFCANAAQGAYTAFFMGDGSNYAIWDIFASPTTNFTDLAADIQSGGYSSALLSSTTSGGFMSGGGERIYSFGPHDFTLSASYAPHASNAIMLQIALSPPSDEFLGADGEARSQNYFNVTMNGLAANSIVLIDSVAAGSGMGAATYRNWGYIFDTSSLAAGAAMNFVLDGFDLTAGHVSVDSIGIASVPEPSRAILAVSALGFVMMRRKRSHRSLATSI